MRVYCIVIAFFLSFSCLFSQNAFQSILGNYISHSLAKDSLIVNCDGGTIFFVPFSKNILKIEVFKKEEYKEYPTFAVIADKGHIDLPLTDNVDNLILQSGNITVKIQKTPINISYYKNGNLLLKEKWGFFDNGWGFGCTFENDGSEKYYGTGSRAMPIDRNRNFMQNFNLHKFKYTFGEGWMPIAFPFYISSRMYGLFCDKHEPGFIDFGVTYNDVNMISTGGRNFRYYLIVGDNYAEILESYTYLTGRQPLPPRWALGYMQSKFLYFSRSHATEMINSMRRDSFPMDVFINDVGWFGGADSLGKFNWDSALWGDHIEFMDELKKDGIKTIVITQSYFMKHLENFKEAEKAGYFTKNEKGETYLIDNFEPHLSAMLDITNPFAMDWFWNLYKNILGEGVAGIWIDLGEPLYNPADMIYEQGSAAYIHNIYNLLWLRLIFEKTLLDFPNRRVFTLSRSGWAGMQRYGAYPWSGDVERSYLGLKAQIPLILGASMSGIAYMNSDIGGFWGNPSCPERYTRWMQFGAFSPLMRVHNAEIPAEPYLYDEPFKSVLRKFVNLRYQLLPYNYTLAWENHKSGLPIMRQMDFYEPQNKFLNDINDQYFWGKDIVVAPIIDTLINGRYVKLPNGKWFNYWNNNVYDGNDSVYVSAPLEEMPLFVRSGSIIPMCPVYKSTDYYNADTLILNYYHDLTEPYSQFIMYNDDGATPGSYEKNEYELLEFSAENSKSGFVFTMKRQGPGFESKPTIRSILLKSINIINEPSNVSVHKTNLLISQSKEEFFECDKCAWWDKERTTLYIKTLWENIDTEIEVIYGSNNIVNDYPNIPSVLGSLIQNPFTGSVDIPLSVKHQGNYRINIYDLNGRVLFEFSKNMLPGNYIINWFPNRITAGVFNAVLFTNFSVESQKFLYFPYK